MSFLNSTRGRFDGPIQEDDDLAPVMQAIDAVQQLLDEEVKNKSNRSKLDRKEKSANLSKDGQSISVSNQGTSSSSLSIATKVKENSTEETTQPQPEISPVQSQLGNQRVNTPPSRGDSGDEGDESPLVRNNPLNSLIKEPMKSREEYELVPKSIVLDVYSNDPEVKRFLKQLQKIGCEFGFNEQDYKCYSCRRPIGMVFGQSRLCHYDGHHYCSECHLGEKSIIPAKILCNWDFNKYPISKRNQHFLTLISNEPMFQLKTMAPFLYKVCPELREIEELRHQAFFVRSYCFTCVQDSVSFELTKLVWPREHLIKQTDSYSLEDLIQIKNGCLKSVLKNVISFGRQHILSCLLCCQRGFICELCKSSQIIYPFETEVVHRCNSCQSIYHKACIKSKQKEDACPRCRRLKARREEPS